MRARIALAALTLFACSEPVPVPDAGGRPDAGPPPDTGPPPPRCAPADGLPDPLVCNGHAALCDRTYDSVAFAMTHNAMSNEEDDWIAPNQGRTLWHQLEDGVHGFMLDTYDDGEGGVLLCHGACGILGERPLADALHDLDEHMRCHPTDVLTIIFEPHVGEAEMVRAFEDAGMLDVLHVQPRDAPWPTLREMIESGRRLVVFTETSDVSVPWYHHAYTYAWDNDYAAMTAADFDCEANRGDPSNAVFVLNHFLTAPLASRSLAQMVNHDPELSAHVDRCVDETGRIPNFVALDFYDDSDLFEVVARLNGL